jgi:hypothetical protein
MHFWHLSRSMTITLQQNSFMANFLDRLFSRVVLTSHRILYESEQIVVQVLTSGLSALWGRSSSLSSESFPHTQATCIRRSAFVLQDDLSLQWRFCHAVHDENSGQSESNERHWYFPLCRRLNRHAFSYIQKHISRGLTDRRRSLSVLFVGILFVTILFSAFRFRTKLIKPDTFSRHDASRRSRQHTIAAKLVFSTLFLHLVLLHWQTRNASGAKSPLSQYFHHLLDCMMTYSNRYWHFAYSYKSILFHETIDFSVVSVGRVNSQCVTVGKSGEVCFLP